MCTYLNIVLVDNEPEPLSNRKKCDKYYRIFHYAIN